MTLVLASQSASRRAMLDAVGVDYAATPAHVDEAAITAALHAEGQPPRNIADALAEAKALKIASMVPGAWVLGSDSVVALDTRMFDKPQSRDDAAAHLRAFSGERIDLFSAAVLARDGRAEWRHVACAQLFVRPLSEDFIAEYLDAEWPAIAACVGCFRIEARGVQLFSRMEGDYFAILGLPLLPVLGQLRQLGLMTS